MIIVSFLACDFRSCFCRNKALRFLHVFGQEVGLFDVWIIDSAARLKHRSRDGRFVVHSIHTQTCLQSCLGIYRNYMLFLYVLCFAVVWLVSCIVSDNRKMASRFFHQFESITLATKHESKSKKYAQIKFVLWM